MPRKKTGLASSTKKRYIKSTCHCLILCQNIVGGLYTIISEGKFTQSNSKTTMDIYARVKYNKPEELFEVVNDVLNQENLDEKSPISMVKE